MATDVQIAANRANAQKSTGPRTAEGKSASSLNALKHGADAASTILPGEDPALLDRLTADYYRRFAPDSAIEEFQVDTLIRADWERRRLRRIEANAYRELLAEGENPEVIDIKLLRDSGTGKLLRRIWSQIASLERAHSRALVELRRLRAEREQAEIDALEAELVRPPHFQIALAPEPSLKRNEPNSPPKPTPNPPNGNPALHL
jgi:hypothetical protein